MAVDLVALVLRLRNAKARQAKVRAAEELEAGLMEWRKANLDGRCPKCGYKRRASSTRQAMIS